MVSAPVIRRRGWARPCLILAATAGSSVPRSKPLPTTFDRPQAFDDEGWAGRVERQADRCPAGEQSAGDSAEVVLSLGRDATPDRAGTSELA